MISAVEEYIRAIDKVFKTGQAGEHSYRPALKELFEKISGLTVVNEPKRSEYGAPDFVFLNNKSTVAYAEAKDINVSLDKIENSAQMERYYGYSNIILTNGLEFRFYVRAKQYSDPIVIGTITDDDIASRSQEYQLLLDTIHSFVEGANEPIKSGIVLAKVMASKARRIRDNIKKYLANGDSEENQSLQSIYEVIKKLLLVDLTIDKFADLYAQTLVYGLFVARYYDPSVESFSRAEARDLIPATNPFLQHFFDHIAGPQFDKRIEIIVSELCVEFTHADVRAIVHNYYDLEKNPEKDPIVHFYEDFLQEYDAIERKKMGVFYTPVPVVRFIVRAVDTLLKRDFGLSQGIADASFIKHRVVAQGNDSRFKDGVKKVDIDLHRVQILDPATGTGTFLNEIILYIKNTFAGQEGRWQQYVNSDLLPRLHGFELMMASYTIAHLKIGSTLIESGVTNILRRIGIYLTNSLEESESMPRSLFSGISLGKAITDESDKVANIKNDTPVMVVLGNPPYSVSSLNKGEWIQNLIKVYKDSLGEKKINLDDDYIKFLRFAEHFIEKNKTGIVAMITNNSFIDGITHRQMRKHLLETFDEIYILDLHGNSKRKEKAPDGGKDANVFDIQQGVSINIFVRKNESKTELGTVYHSEMFGKREYKFETLNKSDFANIKWQKLDYSEPYFFFVPKDFGENVNYERGFKIDELFLENAMGIVTGIDKLSIFQTKDELEKTTRSILNSNDPYREFNIKDGRKYKKEERLRELREVSANESTKISYRPFDTRYMYYTQKSECWINSPRLDIMSNFTKENLGLCAVRAGRNADYHNYYVTNQITDKSITSSLDNANIFPLYLYHEDGAKSPNLKKEIVDEIEKTVGKVTPEDIYDYIYAVLYSPTYREKYKVFLKIDFPRVPYPNDKKQFAGLVALGRELRVIHLLESPQVSKFITTYPVSGSDIVEKISYKNGNVYTNSEQYFGNVPDVAWNFYIGGYQPAQKWLKDRKGRVLSNSDIEHYQKIIVALTETNRIMQEIDGLLLIN